MLFSLLLLFQLQKVIFAQNASVCDGKARQNEDYAKYFNGIKKIYGDNEEGTCVPIHRQCGWPKQRSSLPQFVLVIGLEGSGHHFWTDL